MPHPVNLRYPLLQSMQSLQGEVLAFYHSTFRLWNKLRYQRRVGLFMTICIILWRTAKICLRPTLSTLTVTVLPWLRDTQLEISMQFVSVFLLLASFVHTVACYCALESLFVKILDHPPLSWFSPFDEDQFNPFDLRELAPAEGPGWDELEEQPIPLRQRPIIQNSINPRSGG